MSSDPIDKAIEELTDVAGTEAEREAIQGEGVAASPMTNAEGFRSAPAPPRLTISWDEYMAETHPPVTSLWGPAFLVKGGGYLIISGDTGVGKTILELNLALAAAAGRESFLGFELPGRPVCSLILEAEGSRPLFRDRVRQIAEGLGIRGSLPIFFHPRGTDLSIETLGNLIADAKAEHALLDPVGRFHEGNENDTTAWRTCVSNPLDRIGKELEVAQSFSDHYSKPNENRSGQHKVRGSAAKLQDCGSAMRLEYGRAGGGSRILFIDRVRDGALPEPDRIALKIDVARGQVELDPEGIAEAAPDNPRERRGEIQRQRRSSEAQEKLEAAIKTLERKKDYDHEVGVSERALATESGIGRSSTQLKDGLRALKAQKLFEAVPDGWRRVRR